MQSRAELGVQPESVEEFPEIYEGYAACTPQPQPLLKHHAIAGDLLELARHNAAKAFAAEQRSQEARIGWTEQRKAELAEARVKQRQEASLRAQREREEAVQELERVRQA